MCRTRSRFRYLYRDCSDLPQRAMFQAFCSLRVASLHLARADICGHLFEALARMQSLQKLTLEAEQRFEEVSAANVGLLSKLPLLAELRITDADLTRAAVRSLFKLRRLRRVFLENCISTCQQHHLRDFNEHRRGFSGVAELQNNSHWDTERTIELSSESE